YFIWLSQEELGTRPRNYIIVLLILFFLVLGFTPFSIASENPVKKLFEAGVIAYKNGEFKKAITFFEKTLELYPNLAQSYNYLGLAYKETGLPIEDVAKYYEKAISIDPSLADSYDNLARIYYTLTRYDDAEKAALKAAEINPRLYTARLTLGWTYLLGKSMPDKAAEYFNEVVKEQDVAYAYFGLGMTYFMKNQKFKTFGYITKLKEMGEVNLANQLENVVRDNNFNSVFEEGKPLMLPEDKVRATLSSDSYPNPDDYLPAEEAPKVKIRIKGRPKQLDDDSEEDIPGKRDITGKDRIMTLQKRSIEEEDF
ncbi:MAG: tetratricopeptide repeat protein, partial [Candidatus Omnitrophica bacterium]|nr:tetratricopeptide repeat protein [Candidatus Omnitrophota bacterium]